MTSTPVSNLLASWIPSQKSSLRSVLGKGLSDLIDSKIYGVDATIWLANWLEKEAEKEKENKEKELTKDNKEKENNSPSKINLNLNLNIKTNHYFILLLGDTIKGTNCSFLRSDFDFVHISVADLLRTEIERGTSIGNNLIIENKNKGENKGDDLIYNNLIIELFNKEFQKVKKQSFILLDSFPRTKEQFEQFENSFGRINILIHLSRRYPEDKMIESVDQESRVGGNEEIKEITAITASIGDGIINSFLEKGRQEHLIEIDANVPISDVYNHILDSLLPLIISHLNVVLLIGPTVLISAVISFIRNRNGINIINNNNITLMSQIREYEIDTLVNGFNNIKEKCNILIVIKEKEKEIEMLITLLNKKICNREIRKYSINILNIEASDNKMLEWLTHENSMSLIRHGNRNRNYSNELKELYSSSFCYKETSRKLQEDYPNLNIETIILNTKDTKVTPYELNKCDMMELEKRLSF